MEQSSNLSRACKSCAVAKTKCVSRPGNDCERCHRLKRACVRDLPAAKKRKAPTAKNKRLEQKLDQLVNLLSNNQASSPTSSSNTNNYTNITETLRSDPAPAVPDASSSSNYQFRPSPPIEGERGAVFAHRPDKSPSQTCPPTANSGPSDAVAERCLHQFQTYMAPYFPFVVIPQGTTIAQLRATKPFLLNAIVTVASYQNLDHQRKLGDGLMASVAHGLLMRGEKSLDMLQGLLVWLAWYHPHLFVNPNTTMILQLIVGLVIDLGLKRSSRAYGSERLESAITRSAHGELANSELRTSEERRALLGAFYLTTIVAQWAKRYESMRFTAQLDEVCRDLEQAKEYPSDRYLLELVRVQRIVQRIERKCPVDDLTPDTPLPVAMFVWSLDGELKAARKALPPDLAQDTTLLMHYTNASIYLWELSLSSLPATHTYGDFTYRRLLMFNTLLQSSQAFMAHFRALPPSDYYDLPFVHFSQLTLATIVLSKLSRLDFPGWDLEYARARIAFSSTMDDAAARYEQARSAARVPVHDNPLFAFFARKLRFVRAWNEAKIRGVDVLQPPRNPATLNVGGPPPPPPAPDLLLVPDFDHEDLWDPAFWQQFMGEADPFAEARLWPDCAPAVGESFAE
ncbi:uncharacterized protein K452DRAFT_267286 [Aplosporella prunicola CBS 121167]|uniref:Zn(2)-C6 fungal-type domain-containing protein n=1 Tax=Aplosporella prunicola CBS 121167 TaxID=1176127 RepID=A0A6A6BLH5_9PEZI|nr:uncharacterized protein K452DRAFT_267286 [Aplosporella prunicola CBS 121167]KAF2144124.1 hypothetical protein K452DRAFT_267286 [Aplosporella prunicola CBS 121167]